jgi:hypothetical protein
MRLSCTGECEKLLRSKAEIVQCGIRDLGSASLIGYRRFFAVAPVRGRAAKARKVIVKPRESSEKTLDL